MELIDTEQAPGDRVRKARKKIGGRGEQIRRARFQSRARGARVGTVTNK